MEPVYLKIIIIKDNGILHWIVYEMLFLSIDTNCTLTLQNIVILITMLDIYKVQPRTNLVSSRVEDLNLGPTNYKSRALPIRPHCLLDWRL